jgi:hypothetical protein
MASDSKPPVVRLTELGGETASQRLVRKHLPAWVISGAVHVLLVAVLISTQYLLAKPAAPPASDAELVVVPDEKAADEPDPNLMEDSIGLDPDIPAVAESEVLQDVNVETKVTATDSAGIEDAASKVKVDFIPPPSVSTADLAPGGALGELGNVLSGGGLSGTGVFANEAFAGRGSATRSKLVGLMGGNKESEAAVVRGLNWLAKQQKANGSWQFDQPGHGVAATGMALLPFLAAGHTHRASQDNKYRKNVEAGLRYLIVVQKGDGQLPGGMYAHAIATMALCEALGMSGDKSLLQLPAQKAINYIIQAQGADGGWRYQPRAAGGDTSVVGWQVQALQSAKLCKELVVDRRALEGARKYLDKVAIGSNRARYGYTGPNGGSLSMTAVGLLCRYYLDGWGRNNPGMAAGVEALLKGKPATGGGMDIYYYYYATQVVHFFEGPEWHKDWNPPMRDRMIAAQVAEGKPNAGSWDPDPSSTAKVTGRMGQTCLTLLTLEVYYRHLPLYKREGAGGGAELDRAR